VKVKERRQSEYAPLQKCIEGWNSEDIERGRRAIAEGRVGVIILAGGQGSRFNPKEVKGCTAITFFQKKTLFQVVAERVLAASKLAGRPLSVAFMTSPLNHSRIIDYFRENHFFGLNSNQLAFFPQSERELLDENHKPFLSGPSTIAKGPDGNGALFECMESSGLWYRWKRDGIEAVQLIPIDNIQALPFDPIPIGVHFRKKVDATLLVAEKRDANEKMGVVIESKKKIAIVEYTELPQEQKEAKDEKGFLYRYLNLGLIIFSLDFMKKVAGKELPYHLAKKRSARFVDGHVTYPEEPFAHKYEKFIFDAFLFSTKVQPLLVDRAVFYAPLKNLVGEDSIESVQAALLERDRQIFAEVTGVAPPQGAHFELSQEFYYPRAEFLKKWKGQLLPHEGYIE